MTTKTELNLDEIEARAKAATQGDWDAVPLEPRSDCLSIYGDDIICRLWWLQEEDHTTRADDNCEANAAHIAGMSPSTTLALVEEVRRLREALKPFALAGIIRHVEDRNVQGIRNYGPAAVVSYPVTLGSLYDARNALGEAGRE